MSSPRGRLSGYMGQHTRAAEVPQARNESSSVQFRGSFVTKAASLAATLGPGTLGWIPSTSPLCCRVPRRNPRDRAALVQLVCGPRCSPLPAHHTPPPAGFLGRCNSGFRRKCSSCHQGPGLPVGTKSATSGEENLQISPSAGGPARTGIGGAGQLALHMP